MTSQRTRDRLVERLREKGIVNEKVLDVIRTLPRHLFVDEALGHRPMKIHPYLLVMARPFPSRLWLPA